MLFLLNIFKVHVLVQKFIFADLHSLSLQGGTAGQ
jgi:hypothetical protein